MDSQQLRLQTAPPAWRTFVRRALTKMAGGIAIGAVLGLLAAAYTGLGSSTYSGQVSIPAGDTAAADEFWRHFMYLDPARPLNFTFASVEEMTAASDLVVVGRLAKLYVGELWTFNDIEIPVPHVYATVQLSETLKGVPISRDVGAIEIEWALVGTDFDASEVPIPSDEYLWFLKYAPA
jgi:hypothetical protein